MVHLGHRGFWPFFGRVLVLVPAFRLGLLGRGFLVLARARGAGRRGLRELCSAVRALAGALGRCAALNLAVCYSACARFSRRCARALSTALLRVLAGVL